MATQNVQVFIRSTDIGAPSPIIIAQYTNPVDHDTHGAGMSVLIVPAEAIHQPDPNKGEVMPTLIQNWQAIVGAGAAAGEAARRIQSTFPMSEQMESLHLAVNSIQKYGYDSTKWPSDVRNRQAQFDAKWKYVEDVKAQAQKYSSTMPHDLSSDKAWPQPPAKK
jgi:hypothetical protein